MGEVDGNKEHGEILDSWKSIAAYLHRDVSTVQRWEHLRQMPVHRIQGGKRGAIYAYRSELDAWRSHPATPVEHPESSRPPRTSQRTFKSWGLPVLVGLTLAAVLGWQWSSSRIEEPVRFVSLAALPGEEMDPSFSPDGAAVAFSYRPEGGTNSDIYVSTVGGGEPLRLTNTPEDERYPQWSPDRSRLAFLRVVDSGAEVWVVGAMGGGAQRLKMLKWAGITSDSRLAWSPLGESLVVVDRDHDSAPPSLYALDLATGSARRLTQPPVGSFGDATPVYSPAGNLLAFLRQMPSRVKEVWVMSADGGKPRQVTHDRRNISGLGWSRDGNHLLYLSDRGRPDPVIWRVPVDGGQPKWVAVASPYARMLAVAPQASSMAYTRFIVRSSIWRYQVRNGGSTSPRGEKLITSSRVQGHPQYSPDGAWIAFMSDRTGHMEIWVTNSNGESPRQLTSLRGEGGAPRWSPDGSRIAFDMRVDGKHGIFIVGRDGGPVVPVVADSFENGAPSWSRDGRWIYFLSNRSGHHQVWRIAPEGGPLLQVTKGGGTVAFESFDGTDLYYTKEREGPGLWRKRLPDGEELPFLPDYSLAHLGCWHLGNQGIYYLALHDGIASQTTDVYLQPFGGNTPKLAAVIDAMSIPEAYSGGVTDYHRFTVSPDGRHLLVTRVDSRQSNILVAQEAR